MTHHPAPELERLLVIDSAPDLPNPLAERDIITIWLETKRNPRTKTEYYKDLKYFFRVIANTKPTPDLVLQFLHLSQQRANGILLQYKAELFKLKLSENTINRRVAVIKSLVSTGRTLGICNYTLDLIKPEKVHHYRDTSGISIEQAKQVLDLCDLNSPKGLRDYALLRLLWDNALRRNEISQLNLGDFDLVCRKLTILGKGRGTQKEIVALSHPSTKAIANWVLVRDCPDPELPMFIAVDPVNYGHRLTGDGIYKLVRKYCQKAGIPNLMSPHRWRHGSITTLLEQTNGDLRKAVKFSRHKDPKVLMSYDDNRTLHQQEMTSLLSDLIDG